MADSNYLDISTELSQAVWRFNFRPDSYLHTSWWQTLPQGDLLQDLLQQTNSDGRLIRHMLQQLGLYESVFFDFNKPLSRLALWRSQELEQMVLYLGAMFHFSVLRRIVSRDDIVNVQQVLGTELFHFMQQRAPLITHNVQADLAFPAHMGLKKRFIIAGMLCMRAAFIEYPHAFWQRILYKLNKTWAAQWQKHTRLGKQSLDPQAAECGVLLQKIAIEIKMGVGHDGKILFN